MGSVALCSGQVDFRCLYSPEESSKLLPRFPVGGHVKRRSIFHGESSRDEATFRAFYRDVALPGYSHRGDTSVAPRVSASNAGQCTRVIVVFDMSGVHTRESTKWWLIGARVACGRKFLVIWKRICVIHFRRPFRNKLFKKNVSSSRDFCEDIKNKVNYALFFELFWYKLFPQYYIYINILLY